MVEKDIQREFLSQGEKGGTLTIETQMQSVKLWQMITGGSLAKSSEYVKEKSFLL